MNTVNFTQFLCKSTSENGEDIQGIFDTLMCERGKNTFTICVYFSQICEVQEAFSKYYYRIILRYLGKSRSESKHFRVDSGLIFDHADGTDDGEFCAHLVHHRTTRPGKSGRISILYGFDVELQGNYEVDLYVKKMENDDTYDSCEKLFVKDLELVSIAPFQVIFQTN